MVILKLIFIMKKKITEYRYSADPGKLGNFPKNLAETLASTLDTNVCIEIFFHDNGTPSHIELEQCGDDDQDEEL